MFKELVLKKARTWKPRIYALDIQVSDFAQYVGINLSRLSTLLNNEDSVMKGSLKTFLLIESGLEELELGKNRVNNQ